MAEEITTCAIKEYTSEAGYKVTASDRPMVIDKLATGDVVKLSITVNGKATDLMTSVFTVPKMTAGYVGRFAVQLVTFDEINPNPKVEEVIEE